MGLPALADPPAYIRTSPVPEPVSTPPSLGLRLAPPPSPLPVGRLLGRSLSETSGLTVLGQAMIRSGFTIAIQQHTRATFVQLTKALWQQALGNTSRRPKAPPRHHLRVIRPPQLSAPRPRTPRRSPGRRGRARAGSKGTSSSSSSGGDDGGEPPHGGLTDTEWREAVDRLLAQRKALGLPEHITDPVAVDALAVLFGLKTPRGRR
jgi:hypothetical protein